MSISATNANTTNTAKNAQSKKDAVRKTHPIDLSDDDLLLRVGRNAARVKIARFAGLVAMAAGLGWAFSAPPAPSGEDARLLATPGGDWAIVGELVGGDTAGYSPGWPGLNDNKESLSAALSAKFDLSVETGMGQKTARAVRLNTDEKGVASVVIDTEAAQTPAKRNHKSVYDAARDFTPATAQWRLAGETEKVSIQRLSPTRWRVQAKTETGRPGVLWAYAASVQRDGKPVVQAVAGFSDAGQIARAENGWQAHSRPLFFGGFGAALIGALLLITFMESDARTAAQSRAQYNDRFAKRWANRKNEFVALEATASQSEKGPRSPGAKM